MTYAFRFRIRDDKTLEYLGDDGGPVPVGTYEVSGHEDADSRLIKITRSESNGHFMVAGQGTADPAEDEPYDYSGPRGAGHATDAGAGQPLTPRGHEDDVTGGDENGQPHKVGPSTAE
jgi:hypothetical protein